MNISSSDSAGTFMFTSLIYKSSNYGLKTPWDLSVPLDALIIALTRILFCAAIYPYRFCPNLSHANTMLAETSDHASEVAFLDKIKSVVDDISVKLTELVRDLGKKFDPSALVSFSDILQSIADEILYDFIDALGHILQALLEGLGELIDLFERLGNAKSVDKARISISSSTSGGC
jgi:hypothetical protein